VYKLTVYTF